MAHLPDHHDNYAKRPWPVDPAKYPLNGVKGPPKYEPIAPSTEMPLFLVLGVCFGVGLFGGPLPLMLLAVLILFSDYLYRD